MTYANQQGDVYLFHTPDNGNINIENGLIKMIGGLETAVYLSLFGGNDLDDGRADNSNNWWGNIDEENQSREYHSITQYLLKSLPITTGNLRRLQLAVEQDLGWLLSDNIASSVNVDLSIPALNRVSIVVSIKANGVLSEFEFTENWRSMS